MLNSVIEALLAVWESTRRQSEALGRQIRQQARQRQDCRRLMSIPGIGLVNALSYVCTIEDPARFHHSADLGAYLGLIGLMLKRYQSGEVDHAGRISKCGNGLVRSYLFEAATVLLTQIQRWSALKACGTRLDKHVGFKKKAAGKMAVIMHRMLVTGEIFRWSEKGVGA